MKSTRPFLTAALVAALTLALGTTAIHAANAGQQPPSKHQSGVNNSTQRGTDREAREAPDANEGKDAPDSANDRAEKNSGPDLDNLQQGPGSTEQGGAQEKGEHGG